MGSALPANSAEQPLIEVANLSLSSQLGQEQEQTEQLEPSVEATRVSLKLTGWINPKHVDLTLKPGSVWPELQRGFAIPDLDSFRVSKRERALLKHKPALQRILRAGRPYLQYVTRECIRRGLPTELALLPFVESKFNPHARSRANAAGLWQFTPNTGQHFGLRQNEWLDERKDVIESTRAALDYLTYLYDRTGSWHLALISYNWGPGSVRKAIREAQSKGLTPTLENLEMPLETRWYIPKLQAFKNIIAYPEKYGIKLPQISDRPYFSVMTYNRDLDFRELARLAQIDLSEIRKLNPALKQPVMYAAHTQRVLVPTLHEPKIRQAIARYTPPKPYRVYRVRAGDTLGHIAARFDLRVKDIQVLNSLGQSTLIKPGMSLTLPNPIKKEDWPTT